MRPYLIVVVQLLWVSSIYGHSKLTIDDFFNATSFSSISLSPNGQHVLVHSQRAAWESDCYEHSLWLYETSGQGKQLISEQLSDFTLIKWSPSGNWLVYGIDEKAAASTTASRYQYRRSDSSKPNDSPKLYFYNVHSNEVLAIEIGKKPASALTWGDDDSSLYFVAQSSEEHVDEEYEAEWKDVIVYRRRKPNDGSVVHRIDISKKHHIFTFKISPVTQLNFTIGELLYVPVGNKLVGTSVVFPIENLSDIEIYSIDLKNPSSIKKLTNNQGFETNLKVSSDGKHVFYQLSSSASSQNFTITQDRLYSIDVTNGKIEKWGRGFQGSVRDYTIRSEGGVFISGQLGTNVHVYMQQSASTYTIMQPGWDGTYRLISASTSKNVSSIAFLHSSFGHPEEVYFADHVNKLDSAKAITDENKYLTKRRLPQSKIYQWISSADDRMIEGVLHYPPGKFEQKNLPLLVLIHGGPIDASLNRFNPNFYTWAPLAASEGWLVLEPNYRGSTGYGDQFINDIVTQLLTLPGKDILAGVDSLISDGTADPSRLTVGGYSYGGFLTNWLITQTTRFNAALSGAGPSEHVSMWGTTDFPVVIPVLFDGYPWEVPEVYTKESIIFKLDKVVTPTLIVSGTHDVRVPVDQSFILERGLNYLGVPVNLLLFPNEGHIMTNNPWHAKIKAREELKWLEKYGHICAAKKGN